MNSHTSFFEEEINLETIGRKLETQLGLIEHAPESSKGPISEIIQDTKLFVTPFVTPTKLGLLALVAAYCSGLLPKDRISSILKIIVKFVENDNLYSKDNQRITIPTLNDFIFNLHSSIVEDAQQQQVEAKRDAYLIESRLLNALWSINSIDSLHEFIMRSNSLVVINQKTGDEIAKKLAERETVKRKLLTARSPLGKFVSSLVENFKAFEFEELNLFYRAFVQFRDPTRQIFIDMGGVVKYDIANKDDASFMTQMISSLTSSDTNFNIGKIAMVAREDLQDLLDQQIHLIEAFGTPSPASMKRILAMMISNNFTSNYLRSNYYIKYLECLRDSDYEGCFKALHQYFDYMVSNEHKMFYHYALLSLATLHANFGNDKEALRAIEEAISVAREHKDNSCLNFLLTWLFNFLQNRPVLSQEFYKTNSSDQLLNLLIKKSKETSLSLYSMSYQFVCLSLMNSGGSLNQLLENSIKAIYISINDTNNSTFVRSCQLQSSIWSRTGVSSLSDMYCLIALDSTAHGKSLTDHISVLVRKSYLDYLRGNIDEAFKSLDGLRKKINKDDSMFKTLESRRLLLLSKNSIHKGRFKLAESLLDQLTKQNLLELELQYEAFHLQMELMIEMGNNSVALKLIHHKINSILELNDQANKFWLTKYNILICKIFSNSQTPSRGLSLILKQITFCSRNGTGQLLIEACIVLIQILYRLGDYSDCLGLLNELMPEILSLDNIETTSNAYYLLALCFFKRAMQIKVTKGTDIESRMLDSILKFLEKCINGYKSLSYFSKMRQCFDLQIKVGLFINRKELISHGNEAIGKLERRMKEETSYGVINCENLATR